MSLSFCKDVLYALNLLNSGVKDFLLYVGYWRHVYPAEVRGVVTPAPPPKWADDRIDEAYTIVADSVEDALKTLEHLVASVRERARDEFYCLYVRIEAPELRNAVSVLDIIRLRLSE